VTGTKAEVLFYHLERHPLERVLPSLLERTLERGWRAVVQSASAERLEALDLALWTYTDESFLPHGTARDGNTDIQPIFLTTGDDNPNSAGVRFLVEGAEAASFDNVVRLVFLFDGHDQEATGKARQQWQAAKAAGCTVTYWRQSESGRWEKQG
jgi:DNA polymerase III subunit chi